MLVSLLFIGFTLKAQNQKKEQNLTINIEKDLTIKARIDSIYVFGFDLRESRSAKGGIWNVKTGKAETPLNYTRMKNDTIDGKPVVMLYREVALGNHPLNRWEIWVLKEGKWIDAEEDTAVDAQEEKAPKN